MPENVILSSNYSFQITIDGITDENEYFYSIEGLSIEFQTKQYLSGCNMNYTPITTCIETQPIIIKRPLSNIKSGFTKWCIKYLEIGIFEPVVMNIFIINTDGSINNHWIAENAYPLGLRISQINIENKNPIIMEIITIMYTNLKRIK
jgi:phage tail-like protein